MLLLSGFIPDFDGFEIFVYTRGEYFNFG